MTKPRPPVLQGSPFPLGPSLSGDGVNFCLFTRNGSGVELLFFDGVDDVEPARVIPLGPNQNHTYHYWHVFVPGVQAGQLYGYRVHGKHEPGLGHRFDPSKILLDPYAKCVCVPTGYQRMSKGSSPPMKSAVTDLTTYDWKGDAHPRLAFSKTIIYELHVGGFTKNPNSGVAPEKRGTYPGLIEKIPYLADLGVTAVELLPVFQFDQQDCPSGLTNYWGYSPVSFFSPHHAYATSKNYMKALDEFRDMVRALHKAGIEVILDVVFNHTAEGNEYGPTFSFRGIDNSIYYSLEKDKAVYANYSGTGNTLNANQSIVRRMIIDSLHFWVLEMHVDGFRFDLASILSRDEQGMPIENPPVLWDIESDPVLAGTKLIAEAWDAAGLYQVGSFIGDTWKEWNGKFRDDLRCFMRGDDGKVGALATRLVGSPDIYGHQEREPEQSINFITCHDGFTLNDLVSYSRKHNGANGENNLDGTNANYSWNCGFEGPTDEAAVEAIRTRQIKNFFTMMLTAIGVPMLLMGDEVRRTQGGNNNAYCLDNEQTWFDWSLVALNKDLFRFVQQLIQARLRRDTAQEDFGMSLNQLLDQALVSWHGVKVDRPDWSDDSHTLACTVRSISGSLAMHVMMNAYTSDLEFEIPGDHGGDGWKRWVDTASGAPDDIAPWGTAQPVQTDHYRVRAHSTVILITSGYAK